MTNFDQLSIGHRLLYYRHLDVSQFNDHWSSFVHCQRLHVYERHYIVSELALRRLSFHWGQPPDLSIGFPLKPQRQVRCRITACLIDFAPKRDSNFVSLRAYIKLESSFCQGLSLVDVRNNFQLLLRQWYLLLF